MVGESDGKKTFIRSGTTFEIMATDKNGSAKIKITLP
jgi:hypothetical protein